MKAAKGGEKTITIKIGSTEGRVTINRSKALIKTQGLRNKHLRTTELRSWLQVKNNTYQKVMVEAEAEAKSKGMVHTGEVARVEVLMPLKNTTSISIKKTLTSTMERKLTIQGRDSNTINRVRTNLSEVGTN